MVVVFHLIPICGTLRDEVPCCENLAGWLAGWLASFLQSINCTKYLLRGILPLVVLVMLSRAFGTWVCGFHFYAACLCNSRHLDEMWCGGIFHLAV